MDFSTIDGFKIFAFRLFIGYLGIAKKGRLLALILSYTSTKNF